MVREATCETAQTAPTEAVGKCSGSVMGGCPATHEHTLSCEDDHLGVSPPGLLGMESFPRTRCMPLPSTLLGLGFPEAAHTLHYVEKNLLFTNDFHQ